MSAIDKRIQTFFDAYATSSLAGDADDVGKAYFSTYIEAAPSTVEVFNVDDEYKCAVKTKAGAMKKLGLVASEIDIIGTRLLAPNHHLVDAQWRLRFVREGKDAAQATFRISYVVRLHDEDLKILLALSHEDEEQALQKLDLQ
jgi:hypothetical protein